MDNGGIIPGNPGTPLWAEPERGCEFLIRTTPEQRERTMSIWTETPRRLGVSDG